MESKIQKLYCQMDNSRFLQCIKSGLVMMIPILLIGSFALLLRSLPIRAYQDVITTVWGGAVYQFLSFIKNATFGLLSVYLTVSIAISFARQYMPANVFGYGPLFTALSCFAIFSGVLTEEFALEVFGADGMFTAIVCALGSSALYCVVKKRLPRFTKLYTDGVDGEFRGALQEIFPSLIVILIFAFINLGLAKVFQTSGFQELMVKVVNSLFADMGPSLPAALMYVLISSILWFFGIHGEDILFPVSQHIFLPALDVNLQLVESGKAATEIFCASFFDVFVTMGGCGTTICLILSILLFGKRRSERKLIRFAALPILFNINEILIFGLPVVFNPILFIPFVLTPIVTVLTSSFAMYIGLVPVPIAVVEWTTPVLWGGYLATGSVAGAVLQLVNIVIGIFIYQPFIRICDAESQRDAKFKMEKLVRFYQESEEQGNKMDLLSLRDSLGNVARVLAEDFSFSIKKRLPVLFYQPQYDYTGRCIGVEALLRWEHPLYGAVYPPMLIKLSEETGQLEYLEKSIYRSVLKDMESLLEVLGNDAKVSINVSGVTIQTWDFERFLNGLRHEYPNSYHHVCIEITEQTALLINDALIERLTRIHDMGYSLAIDDFSMGSTSIKYLQSSVFDLIKLDGALSRDIVNNSRSRDIVASIANLSHNFGICVLAEYVETEDQRKILEEVGCQFYQGYLYSSAVPIDQLGEVKRRNDLSAAVE